MLLLPPAPLRRVDRDKENKLSHSRKPCYWWPFWEWGAALEPVDMISGKMSKVSVTVWGEGFKGFRFINVLNQVNVWSVRGVWMELMMLAFPARVLRTLWLSVLSVVTPQLWNDESEGDSPLWRVHSFIVWPHLGLSNCSAGTRYDLVAAHCGTALLCVCICVRACVRASD